MRFLTVRRSLIILPACLCLALGLSACAAAKAAPTQATAPLPTPAAPVAQANTPQPAQSMPDPTPAISLLGLPDDLPQALKDSLKLPQGWKTTAGDAPASVKLDLSPASSAAGASGQVDWIYALAAPFPTVPDEISLSDLQTAWKDSPPASSPFHALLVDASTQAIFSQLWGAPSSAVKVLPAAQLVEDAWAEKTAWAILPFEQLEPRWKVIRVDGQSPVQKSFTPDTYGLTVHFSLQGSEAQVAALLADGPIAQANRRADRLTTVMVTGTTALVRGTASFMEGRGIDYPAQFIGDTLRSADILHVSNEISFAKNCPPPFDWMDLKFCSREKYFQLLQDVGVKVVELTGDHLDDWGKDAFLNTLQMYQNAGMKYYGGGVNIEEARQPALLEHNGNKIAFIGCNAKEPGYGKASETYPGTWHCDMERMAASIKDLRARGYLPIATFQHIEYYSYEAKPVLQQDFRQMADAGAVIVSGSQAHQPQAMELRGDAFLHYGLGNLFFDQTNQGDPPRTAFIDRHIFYDGKYIGAELLTIYLVDYARSRPMTQPEREKLLTAIFQASGW